MLKCGAGIMRVKWAFVRIENVANNFTPFAITQKHALTIAARHYRDKRKRQHKMATIKLSRCAVCGDISESVQVWNYPDGIHTIECCAACAGQDGFCVGCGFYMAGSEADEHSGVSGLCYECVQELRQELGEYKDHDLSSFYDEN